MHTDPDEFKTLMATFLRTFIFFAGLIPLVGCDFREPRWRTYEEENISSGHQHQHAPSSMTANQTQAPASKLSLKWTKPDGWEEQAGSGMRLATLKVTHGNQSAICTMITLSGSAGGLEANVRRWFGQLKLAVPPGEEFTSFLNRQEHVHSEEGFEGVLVNLTEFGPAEDGSSMLAALFSLNNTTLFIKMTGPLELLTGEKDRFAQFCKSLRLAE